MGKAGHFAILTFLIGLITSISIVILVNVIITGNVDEEAQYTLENNAVVFAQPLEENLGGITEEAVVFNVLTDDSSNMLIRFIDRDMSPHILPHDYQDLLLEYVNSNDIDTEEVQQIDLAGNRIFFSLVSDSHVIYINASEYLYILNSLNKILTVLVVAILLLSTYTGYRVGRHFDETDKQVKRFFNNASHELKTPLTSIQGYTESIYLDITPNVKDSCQTVLQQCELMEKLIDELLMISKLDNKAIKLNCNPINIYEIIDRLITYVKPSFNSQNIELCCDFDGDEALICCDERYIYHAFSTIISNGLRFARTKVEITARHEKDNIIVVIYDDGEGISQEDLPHIFKRFYTGKNGISGIGLSLAKEIVKLHKGDISARNNNGAEIRIVLPKCDLRKAEK